MEACRQRIVDLHHAGVPATCIAEVVNCSEKTLFAYNIVDKFKATKTIQRTPQGSPCNKKRTSEFLEQLKAKIKDKLEIPIKVLAADMNVHRFTIMAGIKNLGMKSRTRPCRQLLTNKENRVKRGKMILNWLKVTRFPVIIFSDKKMFTVDEVSNCRKSRVISTIASEVRHVARTKHPQGVVMFGWLGVMARRNRPTASLWDSQSTRRFMSRPWLRLSSLGWTWSTQMGVTAFSRTLPQLTRQRRPRSGARTTRPNSSLRPCGLHRVQMPILWTISSGVKLRGRLARPLTNVHDLKASISKEWDAMSEDYVEKVIKPSSACSQSCS